MFSQCPDCHAIFQVSDSHLKVAQGNVRCGQCLTIFNALEHRRDDLLERAPASPGVALGRADVSAKNPPAPRPSIPAAPITPQATPPATVPMASESQRPEPEGIIADNPLAELEILASDDHDNISSAPAPHAAPVTATVAAAADTSQASAAADITTTTFTETIVLSSDSTTPPTPTPTPTPKATAAGKKIPETADIPAVIRDQLRAEKAARLRPSSLPWALGSLLLLLLLFGQGVYGYRDQLAQQYPPLRPWLEQACALSRCTIAAPYDIHLIQIVGRDVRTHPTAVNALIAATTIINNAGFAQPFPLLTLTFADITGATLAQRRFSPEEYLGADQDISAGMKPNLPILIELQLLDPGQTAVNFEFSVQADPRARLRND